MSYVFSLGDPFYDRPSQKSGDAYLFCNMLLAVQIECLDLDARYILRGERIIAENDEVGNHTGCKSAAFILLIYAGFAVIMRSASRRDMRSSGLG